MHRYTVELLYHFECELCHQWWSYAMTPTELNSGKSLELNNEKVHCMHCGHTTECEIKPNVHNMLVTKTKDIKTKYPTVHTENNARHKIAEFIEKDIKDAMRVR